MITLESIVKAMRQIQREALDAPETREAAAIVAFEEFGVLLDMAREVCTEELDTPEARENFIATLLLASFMRAAKVQVISPVLLTVDQLERATREYTSGHMQGTCGAGCPACRASDGLLREKRSFEALHPVVIDVLSTAQKTKSRCVMSLVGTAIMQGIRIGNQARQIEIETAALHGLAEAEAVRS